MRVKSLIIVSFFWPASIFCQKTVNPSSNALERELMPTTGMVLSPGMVLSQGKADASHSNSSLCQPVTYDGYEYNVVQIGTQCWFAENLRTTIYANGYAIPSNLSDSAWYATNSGASAVYAEGGSDALWEKNLKDYGRLYNWYAVDDVRGLCPGGWHVPTDEEWKSMEMALGMTEAHANSTTYRGPDVGSQMKEYDWRFGDTLRTSLTNLSGLSCLPGGFRFRNGSFGREGSLGIFWSSSSTVISHIHTNAWYRLLNFDDGETGDMVRRGYDDPETGLSVRCVRSTAPSLGCTNPDFAEYSTAANVDDGSCATPSMLGCTDSRYVQYDPFANVDDGTCTELIGCEDGAALSYQGFDYHLVTIGEQCWFVENLEATYYRNGDKIEKLLNKEEWTMSGVGTIMFNVDEVEVGAEVGAWCDYDTNDSHPHAYGKLYNWYAVSDSRALCPNDWHVPTDEEWKQLIEFLGGSDYAGEPMKALPSDNPRWNGSNISGFSGLPGGDLNAEEFYRAGERGTWWSCSPVGWKSHWDGPRSEFHSTKSWAYYLDRWGGDVTRTDEYFQSSHVSVRCIRDAE